MKKVCKFDRHIGLVPAELKSLGIFWRSLTVSKIEFLEFLNFHSELKI